MTPYEQWLTAKADEAKAVAERRKIEDDLVKAFNISEDLGGTKNFEDGDFEIKVTGSIARKVDSDKLQEIAAELGLTEHLSKLFRWKPEINAAAWDSADSSITKPLLDAITSKAGRPTFKIVKKEI